MQHSCPKSVAIKCIYSRELNPVFLQDTEGIHWGTTSVLIRLHPASLQRVWYRQPFLWMDVRLHLWRVSLFQSQRSELPLKSPAGVCPTLSCPICYLLFLIDHSLVFFFFNVCEQLHFIESYLREFDRGFDTQSEEEQRRLKEELYVEVNRWVLV